MTRFISSRSDHWCEPRAHRDPAMHHRIYGPLQGMDDSPRGTIRAVLLIVGTFVAAMLFFIAIGVL